MCIGARAWIEIGFIDPRRRSESSGFYPIRYRKGMYRGEQTGLCLFGLTPAVSYTMRRVLVALGSTEMRKVHNHGGLENCASTILVPLSAGCPGNSPCTSGSRTLTRDSVLPALGLSATPLDPRRIVGQMVSQSGGGELGNITTRRKIRSPAEVRVIGNRRHHLLPTECYVVVPFWPMCGIAGLRWFEGHVMLRCADTPHCRPLPRRPYVTRTADFESGYAGYPGP